MPHVDKSRSRSRGQSAAQVATTEEDGVAYGYAYSVPGFATAAFGIEAPPAGVQVAFVATTPDAEMKLKAWAPVPIERTGQLVPATAHVEVSPPDIDTSAFAPSPRSRALLQGIKIVRSDLKEAGGAFTLEEVQALLNGVSRQAVEKRVKEGSLLAVPGPSNRRRYPAVQFTRDGVVPGLKEVQAALPTRNPWAVLNFLVRPDHRLGGRPPIEVLLKGQVEPVVSAAHGMGEPGG